MNLDFFKSKNNKIIFCILGAIVVLIIIIIVLISGNDKGEILLTCNIEKNMQNQMKVNQTITLSKLDNGLVLVQDMRMYVNGDIEKYAKSIYTNVAKSIEQEYEYMNDVDYASYNVNYSEDSVLFKINYRINDNTNEEIISTLGYDFLNNSINDIKLYFEKGGLICQES